MNKNLKKGFITNMSKRIEKEYWFNKRLKREVPYRNNQRHGMAKYWYSCGHHGCKEYYLYGNKVTKREYLKHQMATWLSQVSTKVWDWCKF